MHELGIVYEVINVVDNFKRDNNLTKVEKIVLEIGQLSQAIPRFIEECYPAAVNETIYQDTKLEIVIQPANARCKECNEVYNIIQYRKVCPRCSGEKYELIAGQEFNIKELLAY
ncbi:hydrogenase maturation nickel metallochaperone HypA [Romboutsia sp.]|uniref:hydrogenase maturation nickel metallochaperone HypA n=1 Tax=Romboutsia sp. TaxID=1965302 RepID=UPI003F3FDB6D